MNNNIVKMYVTSALKKSKISNIKSIIFYTPFIILLLTFIFSLILPTYNHYKFITNGNHQYIYGLDYKTYTETNKEVNAIFYNQNIMSFPDEGLRQGGHDVYYKYRQMVNMYICRNNVDVSKTMFSDKNILKKINVVNGTHIWLSYELAKALHVNIGDTVYLRVADISRTTFTIKDIPIKVTGITRTKYHDDFPTKTNEHFGSAIMFMNDNDFNWLVNDTDLAKFPKVYLSNSKIDKFNDFEITSKELQIKKFKDFIVNKLPNLILTILLAIVILIVVIHFELSFTLKRHKTNMVILNMMGTPITKIRKIFVILTLINFLLSAIIALIAVKFLFMEELLKVYVEITPLIIAFLLIIIIGVVTTIIHSLSIKKL